MKDASLMEKLFTKSNKKQHYFDINSINFNDVKKIEIKDLKSLYFWDRDKEWSGYSIIRIIVRLYFNNNNNKNNYTVKFILNSEEYLNVIGLANINYKNILENLLLTISHSHRNVNNNELLIKSIQKNKDSVINILNKCRDKELLASPEVTKLKLMLI